MRALPQSWALNISAYIATLIALTLLPIVVVGSLVLHAAFERARDRTQDAAMVAAIGAADSLDRDLEKLIIAGRTLGTSRELARGDFSELYKQALEIRELIGAELIVKDPTGRQYANTRLAWGEPLPTSPRPNDARAVATREPVVSDLFVAAVTGKLTVDIAIPVIHGDAVTHVINIALDPQRLADLLIAQGVPGDWTIGVIGSDDRVLARSRHHEEFLGTTASPSLVEFTRGDRGVWTGRTLEGTEALSAFTRSRIANWRVAVAAPKDVVEAPIWREFKLIAVGLVATLAASLLFGGWLGRRLVGDIGGIAASTTRLGQSPELDLPASPVREVNAVARALDEASQKLHRQASEMREFNQRLEREVRDRTADLAATNERLRVESAMRERVEADLRQSQKMEAIGQLTGGIAHDFNNMLTIVLNSIRLLKRRLERGEHDVERYADSAIQGAMRAADLTARLLAYGRRQPLAPQVIDINKTVAGMGEMLRRTIPETIEIETVLAGGLWRAHVDPQGVENAIINLAVNARDAMPRGGKLTIETANAHLDEGYAAAHAVAPGQYIMISVSDTGTGMSSEILERAFEPFFTTKEATDGSGLGLSQVYGFIKQSEGHVKIYSEAGHGTAVKLYLARATVGAQPSPSEEPKPIPAPVTHGAILVVEDEAMVRELTLEMVCDLGYAGLAADSGASALRLLDSHPEIVLLITDIVMPEMNGRELADEALRRRPGLKVLFTTGYTPNAIIHGGVLDPGVHLLTKPHSAETLARKIDEMLRS